DVAIDGMRADEAVAGRRLVEGPGNGAGRLCGANGVVLACDDAALLEQVAQRSAEVSVLLRRHAELARQGLGLERLIALPRDGDQDLLSKVGHDRITNDQ